MLFYSRHLVVPSSSGFLTRKLVPPTAYVDEPTPYISMTVVNINIEALHIFICQNLRYNWVETRLVSVLLFISMISEIRK